MPHVTLPFSLGHGHSMLWTKRQAIGRSLPLIPGRRIRRVAVLEQPGNGGVNLVARDIIEHDFEAARMTAFNHGHCLWSSKVANLGYQRAAR
jgi:hypothetical protein